MGDEEEGMKTTLTLCVITLLAVLSGCGGPGANAEIPQAEAAGETSKDIGDFVVHFSALSTEQIPPDIAKTYDIVRSKNRAMLNVSVIRKADDTAVPAALDVKTVNLTGQLKSVTMRRINEQDAIYYIGETAVANRETLIFTIDVTPEGAAAPSEVRFKRQFYTD
jgi:hypothetical protein